MESAAIFTRACDEVKLKLNDLCIRGLQQTNLALESYPDPTAVLTWMWNVMRLLCRWETGNCLKVVGQMKCKRFSGVMLFPVSHIAGPFSGVKSLAECLRVDFQ